MSSFENSVISVLMQKIPGKTPRTATNKGITSIFVDAPCIVIGNHAHVKHYKTTRNIYAYGPNSN